MEKTQFLREAASLQPKACDDGEHPGFRVVACTTAENEHSGDDGEARKVMVTML